MTVTILSKADYAGSGYKLCQLLRKEGLDVDVVSYRRGTGNRRFNIKEPPTVLEYGKSKLKDRLFISDIVHFKGDWLVGDKWYGFSLPSKRVYTFSGCSFRRDLEDIVSKPRHDVSAYKANYLSTFTPEMCYNKDIHLMEFPCLDFNYTFQKQSKFKILHIPSNTERKGSNLIMEALKRIKRGDVEITYLSNVKRSEVLRMKQQASIYIDQMVLPVYGNAAVESMSFGIPTMNWDNNHYPYPTPIIKPKERTVESIQEAIENHLDWQILEKLSVSTFEYVRRIHGEVGKRWLNVYRNL